MEAVDSAREASRRALDAERLRSSRIIGTNRFVGISVAFVFNWLLPVIFPSAARYQGSVPLFAVYWVAAGAVFWASRRSERVARFVGLDVSLLDMPAAFVLMLIQLRQHPDVVIAAFGVTYFTLLTMASAFALERRRIVLAAVTGALLESTLLVVAGANPSLIATVGLVMFGVAVACLYITDRTIELVYGVAEEQRRRERLGRYFSPQVAAAVEARGDGIVSGERRDITVLFSDLRDFTALAESLDSAAVVELLNDVHGRMVGVLFDHGGTLDKYLGDGMMAYFGAPARQPDHADRALACARAMHTALDAFNAGRSARGAPAIRMGIGLHSGPATIGDVGSPHRREYTAIGDTVNVAARIERLAKEQAAPIVLSETTRAQLSAPPRLRPLGHVAIRGRADSVVCWAADETADPKPTMV
jgi:adenylate cyclase